MNPKRGFLARHTLILAVGLLVLTGAFFQWVFCNPRLDLPSQVSWPTCKRFVRILLSVHCLATSLARRVTSSEAFAISFAHWMSARLFPLAPLTRRDISAISKAMRLAAAMMSFPWKKKRAGVIAPGPSDSHVLGLCRCCSTKNKTKQDGNTKATCETLPIFSDHKLQPRGEGVDTLIHTQSTYRLVVLPNV